MAKKTIIIRPGEKVILPSGTVIDALILDGAVNVTSTCDDLPDPSSYKCGYFQFVLDSDNNTGSPMNEQDTFYDNVKVGNNLYTIGRLIIGGGSNPGSMTSIAELNTHVPDQVLFSFKDIKRTTVSNRQTINLFFKVPESMFDEVEMKVSCRGNTMYYRPTEQDCDSYPSPA